MSHSRLKDAYRRPPLYEQVVKTAQKDGVLPENPSEEEALAYWNQMRDEGKADGDLVTLIGNDLSEEDLDNLWSYLVGDSRHHGWWEDKPHQITYRLLLRLTRAEAELKDLQDKGD